MTSNAVQPAVIPGPPFESSFPAAKDDAGGAFGHSGRFIHENIARIFCFTDRTLSVELPIVLRRAHELPKLAGLLNGQPQPFIGIYDAFSASLASRRFSTLFVSGFGFGASHYGLPDVGFIAWTDLLAFVNRLRLIVPQAHLLVDIDDGFGDAKVAAHVAGALEQAGAFGVVLEDQQRPRRCGHLGGKQVLPLEDYLKKLQSVLARRDRLFVVARTDAEGDEEVLRRVAAFEQAGADAVLADGIKNLDTLRRIRKTVSCPVAFNQIAGGKSPLATLSELRDIGATIIIYSTPCLFAAQGAVENALETLQLADGSLAPLLESDPDLTRCNEQLEFNLAGSDKTGITRSPIPDSW